MKPLRSLTFSFVERAKSLLARTTLWHWPTADRIIQRFRDAGATTPAMAQPFRTKTKLEGAVFIQVVERAVIHEVMPGRYYLDERSAAKVRPPFV